MYHRRVEPASPEDALELVDQPCGRQQRIDADALENLHGPATTVDRERISDDLVQREGARAAVDLHVAAGDVDDPADLGRDRAGTVECHGLRHVTVLEYR